MSAAAAYRWRVRHEARGRRIGGITKVLLQALIFLTGALVPPVPTLLLIPPTAWLSTWLDHRRAVRARPRAALLNDLFLLVYALTSQRALAGKAR